MSGADAVNTISAGAKVVQIYTGLIYKGAETGPRSRDFDQKELLAHRKWAQAAIKTIAKACQHPEIEIEIDF